MSAEVPISRNVKRENWRLVAVGMIGHKRLRAHDGLTNVIAMLSSIFSGLVFFILNLVWDGIFVRNV